MLYELRVYHMHPGRLPAIHKRFSEVTLDLFKDHGIHVCDFYTDAEGRTRSTTSVPLPTARPGTPPSIPSGPTHVGRRRSKPPRPTDRLWRRSKAFL